MNWWMLAALFFALLALFIVLLQWARDRKGKVPDAPPWDAYPREEPPKRIEEDSDPERFARNR